MQWLREVIRFLGLPILLLGAGAGSVLLAAAQPDSDARNNAAAATVLLTAQIWQDEGGQPTLYRECAMGSGSIISNEGDILTNSHVVDVWLSLENLARTEEADLRSQDPGRTVTLTRRTEIVVWMVDGEIRNPSKRYTATVSENGLLNADLRSIDLALLKVTGDVHGKPYERPVSGLPYLVLGDSDAFSRAVTIWGYPSLDGEVVANRDASVAGLDELCTPAPSETIQGNDGSWTGNDQSVNPSRLYVAGDATFGNSGGSAVDDGGRLIGVPTRVEPFSGGSRVVLVPINRAKPYIREVVPGLERDGVPAMPSAAPTSSPQEPTTAPEPSAGSTQEPATQPAGTLVPPPGYGVVEIFAVACPDSGGEERIEFLTDAKDTAAFSPPAECHPVNAEFTLVGLDSVGGPQDFSTGEDGKYQVAVPPKAYLLTQINPDLPGTPSQGFWVREVPGPTRVIVINYVSSPQAPSEEPAETSAQFPSVAEHNGFGDVLMSHKLVEPPTSPLTVRLLRITLAPGSSVPTHIHSGVELDYIEAGTLTASSTGTMMVGVGYNRFATGETQTLEAGSWVVFDSGVDMRLENHGDADLTILSAVILAVGRDAEPAITYTESTPTAEAFDGVTFEVLGDGLIQELPGGPVTITVDRIGVGPGEAVPGFDGVAMLSKVSGPLAFMVSDGNVQVSRTADPMLQPNAQLGDEFELNDNDAAFFPSGYAAIQRDGNDSQLRLVRLLIQPDEELSGEPAVVTETMP